ncbi:MAG: (2Fe-2S)-binding protein [Hyphomicrobiales bacterium]|nr:(2Fe-2S)-binding protein [Hyphomicrobiales bacterium]MBV8663824.1 (2Fe-2S)-binding protein [Hyphomicrobiales bacterium]
MIVCSCNVLSDKEILATLKDGGTARPPSPAQAYRCLGCAPRCGRCIATVRALLAEAHIANCQVGCETCPNEEAHPEPLPLAAE